MKNVFALMPTGEKIQNIIGLLSFLEKDLIKTYSYAETNWIHITLILIVRMVKDGLF